jgi:hypothetical protein
MTPDYPNKLFADKRRSYHLLLIALAQNSPR